MTFVSRWLETVKEETHFPWNNEQIAEKNREKDENLAQTLTQKRGISKFWPIITSGAGLFSDGYVNNVSFVFLFELIFIIFFFKKTNKKKFVSLLDQ